jgi:hypothetical protein
MSQRLSPARLLGAAAISAFFLGSAMAVQPAGATVVVVHPAIAQTVNPFVKDRCPAHGGVRATPCAITFDASNPGPDVVRVRYPKAEKGVLMESDDCASAGIAVIAPNPSSNDQFIVSAGSITGTCSATFAFVDRHGKVVGHANLSVTNND